MEKVYGSPKRQDGLYKIGRNKWELIYGFGIDGNPENPEDAERGWNWRKRYSYRPSLNEIKETITKLIERESAIKMKNGFVWNGLPVEYTEERKSDLTGILVALQGGIMTPPITLNLGSWIDGEPVLHEFTSADEIGSVASALSAHKIAVCNEEWQEKKSVDWTIYETEQ